MNQKKYDVVVLGGGQAGVETALEASKNGLKTAIVEENQIGGSLFKNSIRPLELLLENNKFLKQCFDSRKNGLVFSDVSFDPDRFFEEIDIEAQEHSDDLIKQLKDNNVDIFIGHGMTRPDKTIAVLREDTNTRILEWENLVYAGEPVSSIPPLIRSNSNQFYTGNNIGLLDYIPNGLIIYGQGIKTVNVADVWSSLGCQVYIICPKKELIPNIPKDIEDKIIETLKNQGVKIYTDIDILDLYVDSEGDYHFEIVNNETNKEKRIIGRELVLLTNEGTSLNGIETLNIDQKDGWIKVDDHLQTSVDGIYTWTGSNGNNRSLKTDKQAAEYLGKYLSNKTTDSFTFDEPEIVADFHPTYIKSGITEEGNNIVKGTYQDQDEFLNLYVDKEYSELVGAEIFHHLAHEINNQINFLKNLEVSVNDLIDIDEDTDVNKIIIKAAKDIQL